MAEAVKATITEAVNTAFKLNQAKDTGGFDAYWSKYWKDDALRGTSRRERSSRTSSDLEGMIAMEGISVTKSDGSRPSTGGALPTPIGPCALLRTPPSIHFTYKGTPNDVDVRKRPARVATEWKFVHAAARALRAVGSAAHRSSARAGSVRAGAAEAHHIDRVPKISRHPLPGSVQERCAARCRSLGR